MERFWAPEKRNMTEAGNPNGDDKTAITQGVVDGLYRFPLKGFTPEPLADVIVTVRQQFPNDRIYAVENGPSGFTKEHPAHVSKSKLAVLVGIPRVAQVHTQLNLETHELTAAAPAMSAFQGNLGMPQGRRDFAIWLSTFLDDDADGKLGVLQAPGHRFLDNPAGYVSVINLASVRDLERRMDRPINPLRFRANVYVDGWSPWSELEVPNGAVFQIGSVQVVIFKQITRCLTTHVDPNSGIRDLDIITALRAITPNVNCGLYVHVIRDGIVRRGDTVTRVAEMTR